MYCNLTKTQAFPLAVRVSSHPPRCLNPLHSPNSQSFSFGFSPKPRFGSSFRSFSNGYALKTFEVARLSRPVNLSGEFHCLGLLICAKVAKTGNILGGFCVKSSLREYSVKSGGGFSSSSPGVVESSGKTLPWLASQGNKERKRVEKVTNSKNTRSSWEESAEKFLKVGVSVSETTKSNSFVNHRNRFRDDEAVSDVGEEEIDDNEDPRWDKIKHRANRIVDSRPSFDRPDFQRWNKVDNWGRKTWKEATESTVPKMSGEVVYGVGPVLAALLAERREFYALYVQEGIDLSTNNRKKKDKKGFEKVIKIAEKMGLSRKDISKHDLNMVADNRPHQGLVLDASPLEMVGMKELDPISFGGQGDKERAPLWVALDEVTDPQNLGAIIRSAYFFGAEGVVLCAKNSAPLSGVVSKASAGSMELMELRSCKNMMQFLVKSSENGWRVIGGSVSLKALPINEIEPNLPTILVLGSEGTGLRPLVERSCTDLVRIPGNILCVNGEINDMKNEDFRSFLAVESLNVSVAAGVLLHHLIGRSYRPDQKGVI